VRVGGRKMSKSLKNIYTLSKAIKEFGVDPVRITLTSTSDLLQDLDFNENLVNPIAEQLKKVYDLIDRLLSINTEIKGLRTADEWLSSKIREIVEKVKNDITSFEFRDAVNFLLYEMYDVLRDYFDLIEIPNQEVIRKISSIWIRALAPFAPHIAEELWHKISSTFVSLEKYPDPNELDLYPDCNS